MNPLTRFLHDLLKHDPERFWYLSLSISMMFMGIGYLLLAFSSNDMLLMFSLLSTTMVLGVAAVLPVLCPDLLGIQRGALRSCYV